MKVLLVDDHPLVLSALQAVIERIGGGTQVVGASSANAARVALQDDPEFDLVLLDLALGDADGFDVLQELRSRWPAVPVVVVSASERASDVIRAIDGGAMGFVPKRASNAELFEALSLVMSGSMYVPPTLLGLDWGTLPMSDTPRGSGLQAREAGPLSSAALSLGSPGTPGGPGAHSALPSLRDVGLTPRQGEVLALLLQGLPNKLIARQLNLSVETVKDHVAAVLRALGVSSRTQAVLAISQMTQGQGGFQARRAGTR
jgi:DNA-binding NarL/FixJ family response regulator